MEDKSISLNVDQILKKTFTPNVKGYDPDEVDDFLDQIIKDYRSFEAYYKESKGYIISLESQLRDSKETSNNLTVEKARLESRLAGVKDPSSVSTDNLRYVNRIASLESALWDLGVDPNGIK